MTPSQTQQAASASCWITATALSHRGRRVSPRITQRPFVLFRWPASDTHGGCTRQAALRTRGAPGAAPALLLRRVPGEAGAKRKGRLTRCISIAVLLFFQRVLWMLLLSVGVFVYTPHTGWSTIPRQLSTSLLWEDGWGETAAGIYFIHIAVKRFTGNNLSAKHSVCMKEIPTAVSVTTWSIQGCMSWRQGIRWLS